MQPHDPVASLAPAAEARKCLFAAAVLAEGFGKSETGAIFRAAREALDGREIDAMIAELEETREPTLDYRVIVNAQIATLRGAKARIYGDA